MTNQRAIEVLEYSKGYDGMDCGAPKIALDMAIRALETIEKIKEIITEEEHYEVSNSLEKPHPDKADYDEVQAAKFKRIWKVVAEAEEKNK